MRLRTCATFQSDFFNTSQPKPEFVHAENFGDDVVRWILAKLRERGIPVEEDDPSQEDHGWYGTFRFNGSLFDLVVSYAPAALQDRWLVSLERSVGLFGSILGLRRRGVTVEVVRLINNILQSQEACKDVRWLWFEDVRRGRLDNGSRDPLDPVVRP